MLVAAAFLACGLHFPCDVPTQVDKPPSHVSKKHHSPPLKPPADVVVKVPPLPPIPHVEPEDFSPAPTIPTIQTAQKKKEGKMQHLESAYSWIAGLSWPAIVLALVVLYYVSGHGWTWVKQKAVSIWNSLLGDLSGFKATVNADIAVLKADVSALKNTAPVVAAPAPVAPVAPAPAAPVAPVV